MFPYDPLTRQFQTQPSQLTGPPTATIGHTLRRRLTEVLGGRTRKELGDEKQINSLFEIYGGIPSQAAAAAAAVVHTTAEQPILNNLTHDTDSSESPPQIRQTLTSRRRPLSTTNPPPPPLASTTTNRQLAVPSSSTSKSPTSPPTTARSPIAIQGRTIRSSTTVTINSQTSGLPPIPPIAIGSWTTTVSNLLPTPTSSTTSSSHISTLIPASPNASPISTGVSQLSSSPKDSLTTQSNTTPNSPQPRIPLPISPAVTDSKLLNLPRPVSLDTPSSPSFDHIDHGSDLEPNSSLTEPARGFARNNDEISFIHRKRGVHPTDKPTASTEADDTSSQEDPNLLIQRMSRFTSQQDRPKYRWPILPSSTLAIDITILQSLDTFNVFDYSEDQLVHFSLMLLHDLDLIREFGLSLSKLQNFLVAVRHNYNSNSYHNYYHALAVMHFSYWMIRNTDAGIFLTKLDQLSLLIASLCHDIDHPGSTNGFQIACQSDLALAHNDQSVLEAHHSFVTFELLRDPYMNVLAPENYLNKPDTNSSTHTSSTNSPHDQHQDPPSTASSASPSVSRTSTPLSLASQTKWTSVQFRAFRKSVISAILATDMSKHFDLCRKLDSLEPNLDSLNPNKDEDRQLIIDLLTHCSDLSGQVLPHHMAVVWEARLTQEFIWQAKMELKLGLPVSTFMQGLNDNTIRFKNHLNFIDFVMSPLWMGMMELLPPLNVCVKNLLENRKAFMRLLPNESVIRNLSPGNSEPPSPISAPTDSPNKPAMDRSVTMPSRSLKVGLLRQQQRGRSPPQNVRAQSFSLASDEEKAITATHITSTSPSLERAQSHPHSDGYTSQTNLLSPSLIGPVPIRPMCSHRDFDNSKDFGFCEPCALEHHLPTSIVAHLYQTGCEQPTSIGGDTSPIHSRKSSTAPHHGLIPPASPPPPTHTLQSGGAHTSPFHHSRHNSHSSVDDLLAAPGSLEDGSGTHSHSHSPASRSSYLHTSSSNNSHVNSSAFLSDGPDPFTPVVGSLPDSPQLNALQTMEQRRQHAAITKDRRAARWNALTSGGVGEPIKALPITSSNTRSGDTLSVVSPHDSLTATSPTPPNEHSLAMSCMTKYPRPISLTVNPQSKPIHGLPRSATPEL